MNPANVQTKPAAFLDRDGVINIDKGYTVRPEDLVLTPTAADGIGLLNRAGFRVFVVTNQSGVARGYYSAADVERFHDHMRAELMKRGAIVDQFYYCAYHPAGSVAEYALDHEDRKPSPGMLLRAMRDWPTDLAASVMFGDKDTDMQAAKRAGVAGILIEPDRGDLAAAVNAFLAARAAART